MFHSNVILKVGVFLYLQIDENVKREIINHRSLRHPNIVRFKEVCSTFLSYLVIINI